VPTRIPEPGVFVIFGGTGDLSRRKLLPALGRLASEGSIGPNTHVLALSRKKEYEDKTFRTLASECMRAAGVDGPDADALTPRIHFHTVGEAAEDFHSLRARLEQIESSFGLPPNRAFYLSLPPSAFGPTLDGLGAAKLTKSDGWTRLVIEKPFGYDLPSARALHTKTHEHFDESQVYRIDHYLGKDTVQNLLVLRFANTIFESIWNRHHVESVQIHVAESLGVGSRAGYYDHVGALRDMIQNHLTQLMTLVAMEAPSAYDANAIRYEKIKVLRSLAPIDPSRMVRGQYTAGEIDGENVPGYLGEAGIAKGSDTETFVAVEMRIENWRWHGVPFYLRTGKRLGARTSTISIRLKDTPISLFKTMGGQKLDTSDVLVITLQPNEGFALHFDVKTPGEPFGTERIPLDFQYGSRFTKRMPEAYETLILNVLNGDQTLFVHADEVEESWKHFTPVLDAPAKTRPYKAGSWGPSEADSLMIPETNLWQK
jgi:glucose-6-phosphate 1-dehydrogenase